MININKAKLAFKEYVSHYNENDAKVQLKIRHTYKVVDVSEYIGKSLGLNDEEVELAKLIALLHDIGRFEQIKVTDSFSDFKGFDHADYGVKVLFEDGAIRKFIEEETYDSIIYTAIKNHNKYEIEQELSGEKLLQSKLIRDSDKTDIFRVVIEEVNPNMQLTSKENLKKDTISDETYKQLKSYKLIQSDKVKTELDSYLKTIAYPFNYYFIPGLKIVKEKEYINQLINPEEYEKQETKRRLTVIKNMVNHYIEEKIK